MAWITGHVVSARFMLADGMGLQEKEPFPSLLAQPGLMPSPDSYRDASV